MATALFFLALCFPNPVLAQNTTETVRLQLKWFHQFQFAGYYAAVEKGYFAERGLNVVLLERDRAKSNIQSVLDGDAEYGVADAGLLAVRAQGGPVVLLGQIFQHNPLILITLKSSGIGGPQDLVGKRVMLDQPSRSDIPLLAMINESIGVDACEMVNHTFNFEDLLEGRVDAMSAYITNEPFQFKRMGIPINIIRPQNYGIDFYGDNFFTIEKELLERPERAERMLEAVMKGWQYALDHPNEMIDLIIAKYKPDADRELLEFEARMTSMMVLADIIPLGELSPGRFTRVAEVYADLGVVERGRIPEGFLHSPPSRVLLNLTPEERDWLRRHPVVTLAVDDGYPPMNFRDDQGEITGISVDFIRLLEQRLGIRVEFQGSVWSEAIGKALRHEVDGVINADMLDERKPFLNFTEVYAVYPQALLTRADAPPIEDIDAFYGSRVAVKSGSSQLALLRDRHAGIERVEVQTLDEALDMLVQGRVDGVYDDVAVLHHRVSERFMTNVRFALLRYEEPVGYSRIGLRNNAPLLLSVFNKAIASITPEDRRRIRRKWLSLDFPDPATDRDAPRIELSESEKKWLREHPVIRVGVDPDWRPVEFLDKDGRFRGISVDHLEKIAQMLDIRFDYVPDNRVADIRRRMDSDGIDVFACQSPTPRRRESLSFTRPYVSFPVVIFTRAEIPYIGDLTELLGRRVAVVGGYAVEEWLETDYPGLLLVAADSTDAALNMLVKEEVDALIGNILTVGYCVSKNGLTNIKVAGKTRYSYDQAVGVRKDWPILAELLQRAMDAIPEDERSAIHQRWVSVRYEQGFNYLLVWKIVVAALLVVAVFVFWNQRLAVLVRRRTEELSSANLKLRMEMTERERAEDHLRRSEARFRTLVDQAGDPIFLCRADGGFVNANQGARDSLGYSKDDLLALSIQQIDLGLPEEADVRRIAARVATENAFLRETRFRRKDGTEFPVELRLGLLKAEGEHMILGIARDIGDRKRAEEERGRLEAQLRHAQKMQAVGVLAGGVAHDFNNILQALTGYIDLMTCVGKPDAATLESLREMSKAVDRAAGLVRQLLAFSRKTEMIRESLDLNQLIAGIIKMVGRLIGEHIELRFIQGAGLATVNADPGQLEQILLNLCVNARDAMPEGGSLCIETENVVLDEAYCREHANARPGPYVVLTVSDTGTGVAPEIRDRLFEPFFTTKEVGRGTGLGLATVYAIVERHEGFITVYSEPGRGASFRVSLPAEVAPEGGKARLDAETPAPDLRGRGELVLVAEDDESVRTIAARRLEDAGYRVVTAANGEEAIRAVQLMRESLDIAILDLIMPKKNGRDVYEHIRANQPEIAVLFTSGYSFSVLQKDSLPEARRLLQKPYSTDKLLRAVRETLDEREPRPE